MTTTQTIAHIFESMSADERFLGFGYLGGRRNALDSTDPESPADPQLVAQADRAILDHANAVGWTREDLFAWANSKDGRWFADAVFGGSGSFNDRFATAVGWGVLRKQR